jgi:16S rRNA (adenine1518-N6/adenine1519-N6)-dimethyltransferase
VLVGLKRHGPAPPKPLRRLVQQGFAHRRKALARSLALSPGGTNELRDKTREALTQLGHPADARAETLSPAEWRALWERLR